MEAPLALRAGAKPLAALVALMLSVAACAAPPPAAAPRFAATVDLSHVVREDTPKAPGEAPTRLIRGPDGELQQLQVGADTGSLVRIAAAPGANLDNIEALSPRDLVLPAVLIDVRDRAQDTPGYELSVAELRTWEQLHGNIPPGSLVLLATGWDIRWGDAEAYLSLDVDGATQAPRFGAEAMDLLLNQRSVRALGLDAPAHAESPTSGFYLLLENLTNLEQLPPTGATVVIGALKLQRAQSSPARVLALIP